MTDQGDTPWYIVEATDRHYRDITVGNILLGAMHQRLALAREARSARKEALPTPGLPNGLPVLDGVDLTRTLTQKQYEKQLANYQKQYYQLTWAAQQKKRSSIAVSRAGVQLARGVRSGV